MNIILSANQKNIDQEIKAVLADNKTLAQAKKDLIKLRVTHTIDINKAINESITHNLDRIDMLREDMVRDANQD